MPFQQNWTQAYNAKDRAESLLPEVGLAIPTDGKAELRMKSRRTVP
jgi:hypothetical protein